MFLIDDILLRSLGFSIPGLDMFWLFEQILYFTRKEMYDQIKDRLKENRMLYELGEISNDDYMRTNARLVRQLRLAEKARDMNLGVRTDILGGG
ncbi:MAG: hypothetical protein PHN90_09200 [Methanothrix sp.]|jgi:hypothetical protein|nr:hypothetical protein [Candidatus Omnitrophota bacterium]MDD3565830.1 hypothetical protein [Methanothrix sp.]